MSTSLIDTTALGPLTSVPQCVDNQFLVKSLYSKIAGRTPLRSVLEGVLENREADRPLHDHERSSKIEYLRSLIYSRQVVVNRAAFWNNPLFISSTLGDDRKGLISLIANQAIVPFLYSESEFEARPTFDVLPDGQRAVESLAGDADLSRLVCVRLGGEDAGDNAIRRADMAGEFRTQLTRLLDRDDPELAYRHLAKVLLKKERSRKGRIDELAGQLKSASEWIRAERPNRDGIYGHLITTGNPSDGLYRTDPFTFELKKWIDLAYNANLPKFLGVLMFVPHDFPSPTDAGMTWGFGQTAKTLPGSADSALEEIIERAESEATWQAWNTVNQEANLAIPAPHELNHNDILELRSLPEWETMMERLETHLSRPLDMDDLREFQQAYSDFLKAQEAWWLSGRGKDRRQELTSGVAKVYRVGDWMIGLLTVGESLFPLLPDVPLPPLPPSGLVNLTVETALYLFQRGRVDLQRSQLVRQLRTQQGVTRERLLEIERSLQNLRQRLDPRDAPENTHGLAQEQDP
ncbi:hypothetical protein SAMN05421505_1057 [Sinosporangium album]|uniref:Uncharacterized protein n=1 Tax=Sinosporangium album TaxID=504805 RepID=A0A1G7UZ11_9ACTN|nr:hypothetical protein [Sinosporangium album]SDG51950.1 hypothetical protein SAMN05421505_1057 [Sinosporangium album]